MTISSEIRKAGPFAGNGAATVFPFTFKVLQAADLLVVRSLDLTGSEVVLALGTDYSVSLNADQNANPGGNVTLPAALAEGLSLTIASQAANLQPVDLTNNGGFYPAVINAALDRLTILVQQIAERVERSLKVAISTPAGVDSTLPAPAPYHLIGWNADGTGFQNADPAYGTALAHDLSDSAAQGNGADMVGFYDSLSPSYLKTVSDIINGMPISIRRFMTSAEWNDLITRSGNLPMTARLAEAAAACAQFGGELQLWPGLYMMDGKLKLDAGAAGYSQYGRIRITGLGVPGSASIGDNVGIVLRHADGIADTMIECVGDWFDNTAACLHLEGIRLITGNLTTAAIHLEQITDSFQLERIQVRKNNPAGDGIRLLSNWTGNVRQVRVFGSANGLGAGDSGEGIVVDSLVSNPDHKQTNQITFDQVDVYKCGTNWRLGGKTLSSSNPVGPIKLISCQSSYGDVIGMLIGDNCRGVDLDASQFEQNYIHGVVLANSNYNTMVRKSCWFGGNGVRNSGNEWNLYLGDGAVAGTTSAIYGAEVSGHFINTRRGIYIDDRTVGGQSYIDNIEIQRPLLIPHATESDRGIVASATPEAEGFAGPLWVLDRPAFRGNFTNGNIIDVVNRLSYPACFRKDRWQSIADANATNVSDVRLELPAPATLSTISGGDNYQYLAIYAWNGNATLNETGNIRLDTSPFAMAAGNAIGLKKAEDGTWREMWRRG